MKAKSFSELAKLNKSDADIDKFNPYHDSLGRFTTSGGGASFSGTLLHGSPNKGIKEFDINRAGSNTGSGEKLLFFTNDKQMADDFSYERLPGSSKFMNVKGKKGEVYRTKVKMKNPLDFRNLSDDDIKAIKELDADGILTDSNIKMMAGMKNHGSLKAALDLRPETLKRLGYDGIIANTDNGKTEFAVIDSKQTKILNKTFSEVLKSASHKSVSLVERWANDKNPFKILNDSHIKKFNPYHDRLGRFTTGGGAASFTWKPGASAAHDKAIAREKERTAAMASTKQPEQPKKKKTYSDFIKDQKQKDMDFFYGKGNTKRLSNKYFEFKRVIDDDNCIVVTNNIKEVKGNPVLVVGNNQAVYLKDWQYRPIHNYDNGIDTYAVKLNRKYYKPYTFKSNFDDVGFDKNNTFDDMMNTAKEQQNVNMKFASGHMKFGKSFDNNLEKMLAKSFNEIMKFNQNHDKLGRFASGNGGASASGVFVPAKTIDEAKDYAVNHLGMDYADYDNCNGDMRTVNMINEQITKVYEKYPELKGKVNCIESQMNGLENAMFAVGPDTFNEGNAFKIGFQMNKGYSEIEKTYQENVEVGFHPKGTTLESAVWHEFGHVYDLESKNGGSGRWLDEARGNQDAHVFQNSISKYATKNPQETFAEAFAEYHTSKTCRSESVKMMQAAGVSKKPSYSKAEEEMLRAMGIIS